MIKEGTAEIAVPFVFAQMVGRGAGIVLAARSCPSGARLPDLWLFCYVV